MTLDFVTHDQDSMRFRLSISQIGALAMTLPQVINTALRRRPGGQGLRAYPLTSWKVELSTDPKTGMVTLGTAEGFSVCFSMSRELQTRLGEAIASESLPNGTPIAH